MDLVNETPYPADLFRSELERDVMYNALVGRVRYRLSTDQQLSPPTGVDILKDLRRQAHEDPYGRLEPDDIYGRTGTDLIVLADAGLPDGPVAAMDVRVAAGPYDLTLRVTGDRVWERRFGLGAPRPSEPLPFSTMPVIYKNAFGGETPLEFGALPFAANPAGKGFYASEVQAIGKPLPNVEDPQALVTRWSDNPEPVGTAPYPPMWGLRLKKVLTFNPGTRKVRFSPVNGLFDRAHPRLSGKPLVAGDWVRLHGFALHTTLGFEIPPCPFVAEIQIGTKTHVRDLVLDEILVDLRTGHVDLSYRKLFHYPIRLREFRRSTLRHRT